MGEAEGWSLMAYDLSGAFDETPDQIRVPSAPKAKYDLTGAFDTDKTVAQSAIYNGSFSNPAQEAEKRNLSANIKKMLGEDIAPSIIDPVEDARRVRQAQMDHGIQQSASLRKWIENDPGNAGLIDAEDVGVLTRTADLFRSAGKGVVSDVFGSTLGGVASMLDITTRNMGRLLPVMPQYLFQSELAQQIRPWSTAAKDVGGFIDVPGERKNLATDVAGASGQLAGQIAAAVLTGGAASGAMLYAQGVDQMATKTAMDDASQEAKDSAMIMGGAWTYLTEQYGIDKLLNRVPPEIKNRTMRFIADKFVAGGIEAAQEFTEGLMHDITRRVLTNKDAGILDDIGHEMTVAGLSAALVRTALGIKGHRVAAQQQAFFEGLGDASKESKLRERLPEKWKEWIDTASADGPIQNVFVGAQEFTTYFQGQAIDPAILAKTLGIEDYQAALDRAGNIAIPVGNFAEQIAPTDHLQGLMQDLKLSPMELSGREAAIAEANKESSIARIEKEIEAFSANAGNALNSQIARIQDDIALQLSPRYDKQTADTYSQVMRGIAVATARDTQNKAKAEGREATEGEIQRDISAQLAKYDIKINPNPPLPEILTKRPNFKAEIDPFIDMLRAGQGPSESDIFGKSLGDFIRERGGLAPVGELLDVEKVKTPAFKTKLIQDMGKRLDEMAMAAVEAGYFPGTENGQLTETQLVEAILNEIGGGSKTFAGFDESKLNARETLEGLSKALDVMGLDINTMDNEAIKAALFPEATFEQKVGADATAFKPVDTESAEFKAWFGDSKVVDADGKPLVVYHGTNSDVTRFADTFAQIGQGNSGIYFSQNPEYASKYAKSGKTQANVIRAYLSVKNPFVIGETKGELSKDLAQMRSNETSSFWVTPDQIKLLKKAGYDGIFNEKWNEIVVFDPTQIKSAISNTGAFSREDARILYQPAYHGSPFKFDRFTLDHIGKGEGAQAYGWGLYFAGKKEIAEYYRNALADNTTGPPRRFFKGQPLEPGSAEYHAATLMSRSGQTIPRARKEVEGWIAEADTWSAERKNVADKSLLAGWKRTLEVLNEATSKKDFTEKPYQGQLYEVEIPEDGQYLLWDRPLSEQPEKVREAIYNSDIAAIGKNALGWRDAPEGMHEKAMQRMGGEQFYRDLSESMKGDKAASKYLNSLGIAGIKYLDGTSRSKGEGSFNYVIFDENAVKVLQTFYQNENRAQIRIGADRKINIDLLKGANLSSFLHETGHFYLEFLGDLAENGSAETKADYATILKWFKSHHAELLSDTLRADPYLVAKSGDEWIVSGPMGRAERFSDQSAAIGRKAELLGALREELKRGGVVATGVAADSFRAPSMTDADLVRKTAMHELFARANERYLMEGKAPSIELRAAFARFKAWLTSIYRTLVNLQVPLTDEVREVFDRIYATDAEIAAARAENDLIDVFVTAEQMGVSQAEFDAYKKQAGKEIQAGDDALRNKVMRVQRLKREQWWRDELAKTREEVTAEVDGLKQYQAHDTLTAKDSELKIDRGDLIERFGAPILKRLPRGFGDGRGAIYTASDERGVSVETAAQLLGYDSADALIEDMANLRPRRKLIAAEADLRMNVRYGDILNSIEIADEAQEALHNSERGTKLAMELRALRSLQRQVDPILKARAKDQAADEKIGRQHSMDVAPLSVFNEAARRVMATKAIRDVRPNDYLVAERKANRKAFEALGKKDYGAAQEAKQQELLNFALYQEAMRVKAEMKKLHDFVARFEKGPMQEKLGKAGEQYLEAAKAILEDVELKTKSLKAIDRTKLMNWLREAENSDLYVTEDMIAGTYAKNWKDLTVEEMRAISDALKNIDHVAGRQLKIMVGQKMMDFADTVEGISTSIRDHGGKPKPVSMEPEGRLVRFVRGFNAQNRKISSLVRQMDGGVENGPFYNAFVRSMNERGAWESDKNSEATKALVEIYAPILKMKGGITGDVRSVDELGASLSRGARLSIALNWGNEGNRQRLLGSDYGNGMLTPGHVNAVLDTLTREEWTFVNQTWKFINDFWPEIAAKEKRVYGVAPEKVEAMPFTRTLADGSTIALTGGYYPIKYDQSKDDKAAAHDQSAIAKEVMRGAFTAQTTRKGHTEARVEEVKRPVRLSLDVITEHVAQVTHDLAWHEWLIDATRILRAKKISSAIRDHYGDAVLKTMRDSLTGIAVGDLANQTAADTALMYLRANVQRSTMGFSLTTAFLQPFGLTQSMQRIGVKHVLRGIAEWTGDMAHFEKTITQIREKSVFMKHRGETFNRELHEIKGRVTGNQSKARQIYDASLFMLMQKMQTVADVPTWLGAYDKATESGSTEEESIALADRAVLESQGGGQTKDLTEFQRKHPMLTVFFSYFSVTYNLMAESTAKTSFKNPTAVAGWLSDMMLLAVIPALGPAIILSLLRGEGGDDDEEAWLKKLAKWQAAYLMGTLPGAREASGWWEGFGYSGVPAGRIVSDTQKLSDQVMKVWNDEADATDEQPVLAAVRFLGSFLGIPTVQAIRTYKGWKAWDDGEAPASAVLVGPPRAEK